MPSDDTQMAYWTLEHLLDRGRILPPELASIFTERTIFGIGKSTRDFVAAFGFAGALKEIGLPHRLHCSLSMSAWRQDN